MPIGWDGIRSARSWVHDPANATVFQGITLLTLDQIHWGLPPEISLLTNLQCLSVHATENKNGRLTGLPKEIGSLKKLKTLLFTRGHDFEEIPPVVAELISLETLSISGPIREIPEMLTKLPNLSSLLISSSKVQKIPDSIWRHVHKKPTVPEEFSRFLFGQAKDSRITFGVEHEQLREIPLMLHLKQNWTFSYFNLLNAAETFLNCVPFEFCLGVPRSFLNLVSALVLIPLQTAINLPIFLFNMLVMYGVEPLATAFQDLFGYRRKIRLDWLSEPTLQLTRCHA